MFLGEAACLTAALGWATAIHVFRRPIAAHDAPAANLFKSVLAALLLGLTLTLAGGWRALAEASPASLGGLALSGVIGLLAVAFYGERLAAAQLLGGAGVLAGVAIVVAPRSGLWPGGALPWAGVGFAVLAACGQAAGVVLAKAGLEEVAGVAVLTFFS